MTRHPAHPLLLDKVALAIHPGQGGAMDVLVAGASGFVGRRLCPALEEAGHVVRAMTRHPDDYQGVGEPVRGDVTDADSLAAAAQGCDAAYYLVHCSN